MTLSRILRSHFVLLIAAALSLPVTANAHDGHKNDMSDAEMAQMEMHGAPSAVREPSTVGIAEPASATATTPLTAERALEAKIAENRITSAGDLFGRGTLPHRSAIDGCDRRIFFIHASSVGT